MMDERIKFRHLQCFLAVAQHGSLQKAADVLAITQPAVSKTLKELEDLLGVRLFARGRKGAALMGRHIVEHGVKWEQIIASPAVRVAVGAERAMVCAFAARASVAASVTAASVVVRFMVVGPRAVSGFNGRRGPAVDGSDSSTVSPAALATLPKSPAPRSIRCSQFGVCPSTVMA